MAQHIIERRIRLKTSQLARQLTGRPKVVGVQECEELAASLLDSAVARGARPRVWLGDHPDGRTERPRHRRRRIVRPVVHHDDFDRPVRLRQDALDRRAYVALRIVRRYHGAHQGCVRFTHGVLGGSSKLDQPGNSFAAPSFRRRSRLLRTRRINSSFSALAPRVMLESCSR